MRSLTIAIVLTALVLQGCVVAGENGSEESGLQVDTEGSYVPPEGLSDKERFRRALNFLENGREEAAKAELSLYLESQPGSGIARGLIEEIDTPIDEYFPQEYREVTLESGESLSTLARKYLGSVYLFHALARYNDIAEPNKLTAGETIRIPLTHEAVSTFASEPRAAENPDSVATP